MSRAIHVLLAVVGMLAAALSWRAQAAACLCPPCPHDCPNGLQDVAVMFMPSEPNAQGSMMAVNACRMEFNRYAGDTPKYADKLLVSRTIDIKNGLRSIAHDCKRVIKMMVCGHGSKGEMALGSQSDEEQLLSIDTVGDLNQAGCALAPEAQVRLSGCNSGEGCVGSDFAAAVGYYLLPKGGNLQSYTSLHVSNWVLNLPDVGTTRSVHFDTETLTHTSGGTSVSWPSATNPTWNPAAESMNTCNTELSDALARLNAAETAAAARPCGISAGVRKAVTDARTTADEARALRAGKQDRFVNTGTGVAAARKYRLALDQIERARTWLANPPPCDPSVITGAPPVGSMGAY